MGVAFDVVLVFTCGIHQVSWSAGLFSDQLSFLSFLTLCIRVPTFECELLISPSSLSLSHCNQIVGNALAVGSVSDALSGVTVWCVMSMLSTAVEGVNSVAVGWN